MRYWEGADRCMTNKTTTPSNISSSRDILEKKTEQKIDNNHRQDSDPRADRCWPIWP
jgi:hypothetical protein